MTVRDTLQLILFSIFLTSCNPVVINQPNSEFDFDTKVKKFKTQSHHWGQPGESIPNNGWSEYSRLKYSFGSEDYLIFKQGNNEFSASVFTHERKLKFSAVSIPRAGLFYFPNENLNCAPDYIEGLGLYAEEVLFYISKAFPIGPSPDLISTTKKISGSPVEYRFMQAIGQMKSKWSVVINIEVRTQNEFKFKILKEGIEEPIIIAWENNTNTAVIPDDEALSPWLLCWSGIQKHLSDGSNTIERNISDHKTLDTFGEVRSKLQNAP